MSTLLPVIALAVAIAALLLPDPETSPPAVAAPARGRWPEALLAVLFVATLFAAWRWGHALDNGLYASLGFGLGAALAVLAHYMTLRSPNAAISLALASAAGGTLHVLSDNVLLSAQLGLLVGVGVGAWLMMALDSGSAAPATALFAGAVVATDVLGRQSLQYEAAWKSGSALALAAACVALGIGLARKGLGGSGSWLRAAATLVLLSIAGWIVGNRFIDVGDTFTIFAASAVVAIVVHWLMPPEESQDSLRFVLATVLWLALATWAFGMRKGFGMAVGAVGASSLLLILGNRRALLSMGPLLAFVFYRLFREAHVDASRALDIGQHYAMIGVAIGAILPLLPLEWIRERATSGARTIAAAILWMLLFGAFPIGAAILLGPKGLVGLLVGLGLASFTEGLRGGASLVPPALAAGAAAIITLSFDWMSDLVDLTREEKLQVLYWMAPALAVVGAAIALLAPRRTQEASA